MSRRAAAWGLVAVAVYVAGAAISASLSPLARRPLLDGLGPLAPYRWVDPPPDLADTNQRPLGADVTLSLGPDGSESAVLFSGDNQITIVLASGTFAPHGPDRSVRLEATPVAPASLDGDAGSLAFFGNAIRIEATYRPSGDPARRLEQPLDVILTYPATPTLHARTHHIAVSSDGRGWQALDSIDSLAQQQVEASMDGPGYAAVVGRLTPTTPSVSTPGTGSPSEATLPAVLLGAAALVAGIAGVVLIVRGGRSRR